ncbi:MAG TPA: DUF2062 domain-containing protein [Allosphingosinicella sp.]|nr:DUF2062 domain-containing protein [Allosphingosinicella sp.]
MAEDGGRIARWARKNMPKREDLARSPWIKPFGKRVLHSEFWRFTRRSVPRGVAVGLLVGIFIMIPGLQIIGSALLCIPCRGNIPVAALMTFLSNPFTTPFILTASYFLGDSLGLGGHKGVPGREATISDWFTWLFSDAAMATVSGLFIIAVISAVIGYFASILIWRWWTAHKWRRRARHGGS